jgi:hypothetical protein
MKFRILLCSTLVCSLALLDGQVKSTPASTGAATEIPHVRKQGTATQLIVDGKPFLALTGELTNNAATDLEYMKRVWPKLVETKLNSVLAGVSWAQIEPQEGKFNFSVLDGVIQGARLHNLRLVLLWFASWKNGASTYTPDWVKKDCERFPLLQRADGRSAEILTPFSDTNRDADARAYAAMMRHIKAVDGQQHTVILIQVENEIGALDRSLVAMKAFAGQVPKELMDYLQPRKDTLIPELRQVWEAAGFKTSGTWEEVFGKGGATDEIFMSWYFARYVNRVAEAGKAEYPIPMYVNGYVNGFPRAGQRAGGATGSPMADSIDVWRAAAPKIDLIGVDAYRNFVEMSTRYHRAGNPLFVPETRGLPPDNLATRALYAFGRHDAIGMSLMAVERFATPDIDLTSAYDVIRQLAPLISAHQGDGTMSGVLVRAKEPPQKVKVGDYTLEASYFRLGPMPGAPVPEETFPSAGAIFIQTGPDEFYAAGNGVSVSFTPNTPGLPQAGLATVEEGVFVNGRWVPGRRLAGDDTNGHSLVLPRIHDDVTERPSLSPFGPSQKGIQRVTLYRYR